MEEWKSVMKKKGIFLLVWAALVLGSQFLKFNMEWGANTATFSFVSLILPLLFLFFRLNVALPLLLVGWVLTHIGSSMPLTLGIPTLMAAFSWKAGKSKFDKLFHIALSLLCMGAFIFCMKEAYLYTLYWLIPMGIVFLPSALFGNALKSTFIAHMVGSVLWIYQMPMNADYWIALIPVVAIERLVSALVIVGALLILRLFAKELAVAK